jgi:hypothetical protein
VAVAAAMLIMSGTAIFYVQRQSGFLPVTSGQEVLGSFFPLINISTIGLVPSESTG